MCIFVSPGPVLASSVLDAVIPDTFDGIFGGTTEGGVEGEGQK